MTILAKKKQSKKWENQKMEYVTSAVHDALNSIERSDAPEQNC